LKRVVYCGLLACFIAACGSESFTETESPRAPLFPGFESYASREEVATRLPAEAKQRTLEEIALGGEDSKPPYRIRIMEIAPVRDLNEPGALLLTFYNDRLLQTAFYPDSLEQYLAALKRSGTELKFGRELVNGHTVLWIGSDFDNRYYIGWADRRLREQQRRWLARFS
jgi:hypothetical protein